LQLYVRNDYSVLTLLQLFLKRLKQSLFFVNESLFVQTVQQKCDIRNIKFDIAHLLYKTYAGILSDFRKKKNDISGRISRFYHVNSL
ncbi:hypothetical protein COE03_31145, partial [Bacillus thuringiensis]